MKQGRGRGERNVLFVRMRKAWWVRLRVKIGSEE
jgi:hypothetical protein